MNKLVAASSHHALSRSRVRWRCDGSHLSNLSPQPYAKRLTPARKHFVAVAKKPTIGAHGLEAYGTFWTSEAAQEKISRAPQHLLAAQSLHRRHDIGKLRVPVLSYHGIWQHARNFNCPIIIPTFIVPLLLITHGLCFWILVQPQPQPAIQESRHLA